MWWRAFLCFYVLLPLTSACRKGTSRSFPFKPITPLISSSLCSEGCFLSLASLCGSSVRLPIFLRVTFKGAASIRRPLTQTNGSFLSPVFLRVGSFFCFPLCSLALKIHRPVFFWHVWLRKTLRGLPVGTIKTTNKKNKVFPQCFGFISCAVFHLVFSFLCFIFLLLFLLYFFFFFSLPDPFLYLHS